MLVVGSTWQCIGAWQDSQTSDEAVHVAAGLSYWQTRDFRLNQEHPPLMKLLAALPLLARPAVRIDTRSSAWANRSQWTIGGNLMWAGAPQNLHTPHLRMFIARLPMIGVWVALAIALFLIAGTRWGPWAGVVAMGMFIFDPNFLGHGHLATNDVFVSLMILLAVWATERMINQPSWPRAWMMGTLFALAEVTKFSAIFLAAVIPLLLLISVLSRQSRLTWGWLGKGLGAMALAWMFVTWMAYGFTVQRLIDDPGFQRVINSAQEILLKPGGSGGLVPRLAHAVQTPAGKHFLATIDHIPVPAFAYFRGLFSLASHDYWGHSSFLLGHTSVKGWWYYFPVAMAVKTPIITILLFCAWLVFGVHRTVLAWRHRVRRLPTSVWIYGLPPIAYFAWSLTSHIDIGVRHIFPVYPFIFLAIGSIASQAIGRWKKPIQVGLAAGVIGLALTAGFAWPHTLAYFNALAGGTKNGTNILLDSNFDWNQDIWRLRSYLDRHPYPEVHLALFGTIPEGRVFPEAYPVLQDQEIQSGIKPSGIVIVSAGILYDRNGSLVWLRPYRPIAIVGSSIYVYDFR